MVGTSLKQVGNLLTHHNTAQHTTSSLLKDIIAGLETSTQYTARREEQLEFLFQTSIYDNNENMERLIAATKSHGRRAGQNEEIGAVSCISHLIARFTEMHITLLLLFLTAHLHLSLGILSYVSYLFAAHSPFRNRSLQTFWN